MSKKLITTEQIKDFEDKVSSVFVQHDYYQHLEVVDCENIDITKINVNKSTYLNLFQNDRYLNEFEYRDDGFWYLIDSQNPDGMRIYNIDTEYGITFTLGYTVQAGAKFGVYSEYLAGKTQYTVSPSIRINHIFLNGMILMKDSYDILNGNTIAIKDLEDGSPYTLLENDTLTII